MLGGFLAGFLVAINCMGQNLGPKGLDIQINSNELDSYRWLYDISRLIWVFPKIGVPHGTPKWMVYNGKPYQDGMIWGYHYFWKHPYVAMCALAHVDRRFYAQLHATGVIKNFNIHSLKLTKFAPENRPFNPKGSRSVFLSHPFSGVFTRWLRFKEAIPI